MTNKIAPVDAHLISRAKSGDVEAFGQLYERYAAAIFRYVYARLGEEKDAEDLTEEIFIKAWRSLPNYEERGYLYSAYLFKLAHNAVVHFYRKSKRQVVLNGDELEAQVEAKEFMDGHFQRQELRQALSKLPEHHRSVLELRFFGELSCEETAQVMGRSAGAVRVMQYRALATLRRVLKGHYERAKY